MAVNIPDSFSLKIDSTGENPSRIASVAWLVAAQEATALADLNPNAHDIKKTLKEYVNKNSEAGVFIKGRMLGRSSKKAPFGRFFVGDALIKSEKDRNTRM